MILLPVVALVCILAWVLVALLPRLLWPPANAAVGLVHRLISRTEFALGHRVSESWAAPMSEGPLLAMLAAGLVLGLWAFFGILENVVMGAPIVGLDKAIYQRLQSLRDPNADAFLIGVTQLGDSKVVMPVTLAALTGFVWLRRWRAAVVLIFATAGAALFVGGIKSSIQRPRPVAIYDGLVQYSFPSGHATMSVVLYGTLAFLLAYGQPVAWRRRVGFAALTLIGLISFSRIYLGAHWLSDVLAGLAFGIAWVAALAIVFVRGNPGPVPARPMAALVVAAIVAAGTFHMVNDYAKDQGRYAVRAALAPKPP